MQLSSIQQANNLCQVFFTSLNIELYLVLSLVHFSNKRPTLQQILYFLIVSILRLKTQCDHVARDKLFEFIWCTLGYDAPIVYDGQPVSQHVSLFQVMSGHKNG